MKELVLSNMESYNGTILSKEELLDRKIISSNYDRFVQLFKDKDGNYYVTVLLDGENYIVKTGSFEDTEKFVRDLFVNIDYCHLTEKNNIISFNDSGENIKIVLPERSYDEVTENSQDNELYGIEQIEVDNEERITTGMILKLIENPNSIRINGHELKPISELIPTLIDAITKEDIVDFSLKYYRFFTNYVIIQELIDSTILTDEQKEFISEYKANSKRFNIADMLRNPLKGLDTERLEKIQKWEEIFSQAPRLKKSIVVYRGGSGTNRNNEVGNCVLYDGLNSFTINQDVAEEFDHGALYRMVLPKDTRCLSLFTMDGITSNCLDENEILLPSFLYEVDQIYDYHGRLSYELNYIGNVSLIELFKQKISKYLSYQGSKDYFAKRLGIDFSSDDSLSYYIRNGYDERINEKYDQIDIKDAIMMMCNGNILNTTVDKFYRIMLNPLNYESGVHGYSHIQRVYFLASLLTLMDNVSEEDKRVILKAVEYHDIGRVNDDEDNLHGSRSVDKLKANIDVLEGYTDEEKDIIYFVIAQHCNSTKINEEALQSIPPEKRERYRRILNYLKDADKLDRVRLGAYDTTDINRLSLESSKHLSLLSYELEKYDSSIILDYLEACNTLLSNRILLEEFLNQIEATKESRKKINPDMYDEEILDIARRLIDGENIRFITSNRISSGLKDIDRKSAVDYFGELVNKIKNLITKGPNNGKRR